MLDVFVVYIWSTYPLMNVMIASYKISPTHYYEQSSVIHVKKGME
jgi:hypothetical protein